jgi:hypothetical protein
MKRSQVGVHVRVGVSGGIWETTAAVNKLHYQSRNHLNRLFVVIG